MLHCLRLSVVDHCGVDRAGTDDAQDGPYDDAPQGMRAAFHGGSIFCQVLGVEQGLQKKSEHCGEGSAPDAVDLDQFV